MSRQVARNGRVKRYRATRADEAALERARRPKPSTLATCPRTRTMVEAELADTSSPQQIAGWLARTFPDGAELWVSHETIYRSLFVQSKVSPSGLKAASSAEEEVFGIEAVMANGLTPDTFPDPISSSHELLVCVSLMKGRPGKPDSWLIDVVLLP